MQSASQSKASEMTFLADAKLVNLIWGNTLKHLESPFLSDGNSLNLLDEIHWLCCDQNHSQKRIICIPIHFLPINLFSYRVIKKKTQNSS